MNKIQDALVRFLAFFSEVGAELKKSTWPTRSELMESTLVVILTVIMLGIFIGVSDFVLMQVLKIIL